MREILFRGKRKDTNKWIEGMLTIDDFCYPNEKLTISREHCIKTIPKESGHSFIWQPVFMHTVGQYTGLTDKNGKKIYDGDIGTNIDGIFLVCWDEEKAAFVMRFTDYPFETLYLEEMWDDTEIIGNIYDNPELVGCDE